MRYLVIPTPIPDARWKEPAGHPTPAGRLWDQPAVVLCGDLATLRSQLARVGSEACSAGDRSPGVQCAVSACRAAVSSHLHPHPFCGGPSTDPVIWVTLGISQLLPGSGVC